MVHEDELKRELLRLFGEDAAFTSDLYLRTLRVLEQIALDANARNASWGQRATGDTLKGVYAREAAVFAEVARELARSTARIKDVLDGVTVPPVTKGSPESSVSPEATVMSAATLFPNQRKEKGRSEVTGEQEEQPMALAWLQKGRVDE